MTDPIKIKELLGPLGDKLGVRSAAKTGAIWQHWEEIVGPAIAAHAEPTSLREGVLRVRTDSPAWATEITYLARDLVRKANEVAGQGVVDELKVWTAPGEVRPAKRPQQPSGSEQETASDAPLEDPLEALEAARAAWARRHPERGKGDL
jgi:predicted nucleic acid-binding Zn ribbon protein